MRYPAIQRPFFVLVVFALAGLLSQPAAAYPLAGFDEFDSNAQVTMNLTNPPIGLIGPVTGVGPTRVQRGNPYIDGGLRTIDTEIVSMSLSGVLLGLPVSVRLNPGLPSTGRVQAQAPGTDFPADSFFDIFVEIQTPVGTFHNGPNDPIRMEAVINALPPLGVEYIPPPLTDVPVLNEADELAGTLTHVSHIVGQHPSFSVARLGPSFLGSADIFDRPTTLGIPGGPPGVGLGLAGSVPYAQVDEVDGLSYGSGLILNPTSLNLDLLVTDLKFSVDPVALGVFGSAVNFEATKPPNEAHGDEFVLFPPPFGGLNLQVLDEDGVPNFGLAFPLAISDDVDALTCPPTSFVDGNGDGTPESPVYFSLDLASASLAVIPGVAPNPTAVAGDILRSVGGGPPAVFLSEAALGLGTFGPGDDVDAFCLDLTTSPPTVLYSLTPGSPTLAFAVGGPYSPSDLFLVPAAGPTIPPPVPPAVYYAALGLLFGDNLNALKCTQRLETRGWGGTPEPHEQTCINTLNKGFDKVAKAMGKHAGSCLKAASKSKLPGTAEQCLADTNTFGKDKVSDAQAKTSAKADQKCEQPPDCGPRDAETINLASVEKEIGLIRSIFGSDLDAAIVVVDKGDPQTKIDSKCQQKMAKQAAKCQGAYIKEFNSCKKGGLKAKAGPPGANVPFEGNSDLQLCMGWDPKSKIAKQCGKLEGIASGACEAVIPEEVFLGLPGVDTVDIEIVSAVRCQVCLALNVADRLNENCDLFDDGQANGSCSGP